MNLMQESLIATINSIKVENDYSLKPTQELKEVKRILKNYTELLRMILDEQDTLFLATPSISNIEHFEQQRKNYTEAKEIMLHKTPQGIDAEKEIEELATKIDIATRNRDSEVYSLNTIIDPDSYYPILMANLQFLEKVREQSFISYQNYMTHGLTEKSTESLQLISEINKSLYLLKKVEQGKTTFGN